MREKEFVMSLICAKIKKESIFLLAKLLIVVLLPHACKKGAILQVKMDMQRLC